MLERNILSHLKLAVLLSILSASILLRARLVPIADSGKENGGVPLASVEFAAAILCICAGGWEYYQGYWDLRTSRPFLAAPKYVSMYGILWNEVGILTGSWFLLQIAFDTNVSRCSRCVWDVHCSTRL